MYPVREGMLSVKIEMRDPETMEPILGIVVMNKEDVLDLQGKNLVERVVACLRQEFRSYAVELPNPRPKPEPRPEPRPEPESKPKPTMSAKVRVEIKTRGSKKTILGLLVGVKDEEKIRPNLSPTAAVAEFIYWMMLRRDPLDSQIVYCDDRLYLGSPRTEGEPDYDERLSGLPTKTLNALVNYDVCTVEKLRETSDHELMCVRNLGRTGVRRIRDLLASLPTENTT